MKIKSLHQHYFTLLEILVVLSLIGLISGVVALNVGKMFSNQKFRNEVSLIVDQLRLAQDLMLILDTDVHVIFAEDKSGTHNIVGIEGETRLPDRVQKELNRKHAELKLIKGVFFEDKLPGKVISGKIDIKFLSKGAVMSQGIIRLATSSDEKNLQPDVLQNFICLPGYIHPIFSYETLEAAQKACNALKDEEFDKQLTQDTFSRLPEKMLETSKKEEPLDKNKSLNPNPSVKK